jgi:hypothetical protein
MFLARGAFVLVIVQFASGIWRRGIVQQHCRAHNFQVCAFFTGYCLSQAQHRQYVFKAMRWIVSIPTAGCFQA